MLLVYIVTFTLGLALGSFINVVISRLDRKEGLFWGRSECPQCLAKLKWYDLFPILSYLLLRGRCRYCQEKISYIYPVVELTTAIVLTAYFAFNGLILDISTGYTMLMLLLLTALVFFDLVYLIIPDKIIIILVSASLVYNIFFRQPFFYNFLISGFIFGTFFAIIHLMSNGEWMGLGDAKLALAIGFILGYPAGFFAIVISVWLAALCGVSMILLKRANLKTALPFGSFLSTLSIIFIIFQNEIQKIQFVQRFL